MIKFNSLFILLIQSTFLYNLISPFEDLFLHHEILKKSNSDKPEENKILVNDGDEIRINLVNSIHLFEKIENSRSEKDLTEIKNILEEEILKNKNKGKSVKNKKNQENNIIATSSPDDKFNITSLGAWDDIVAGGLWLALFIIFGPTAIVVLIIYICCKNVVLRNNQSALLG
jgi:hypothetical protein